jgi:hypothetical protein
MGRFDRATSSGGGEVKERKVAIEVMTYEERMQRIAKQIHSFFLNLYYDLEAGRERRCRCGERFELIDAIVVHQHQPPRELVDRLNKVLEVREGGSNACPGDDNT